MTHTSVPTCFFFIKYCLIKESETELIVMLVTYDVADCSIRGYPDAFRSDLLPRVLEVEPHYPVELQVLKADTAY